MLILARNKHKDTILIADGLIKVIVLGVQPDGTVRLGFDAPKDISIRRAEVSEYKEALVRR